MRWRGREESENVRDQRGMSPGKVAAGGGVGIIAIIFMALFFGPEKAQQFAQQQKQRQNQARQQQQRQRQQTGPINDDAKKFVGVVLKDTETVWTRLFKEHNMDYEKPILNLFSDQVRSKCGDASSAMGPFYCPGDNQVYIDPTFFDQLEIEHNAPGDFARAFVIAHEVGHHIQNVLGWNQTANKARRAASRGGRREKLMSNQESVRLELQADYLAGVWAHHAHKYDNILESGDLQEAMKAAVQIGDDTLQAQARGKVIPEEFTHGSAKQRQHWFMEGVKSGNFEEALRLTGGQGGARIPYNQL